MDARNYGLGHIYYLKKKGATIITEHLRLNLEEINYVTSDPTLTSQTLYHRHYAIDCQIELDIWSKRTDVLVDFYHREIESIKGKGKLKRKTRLTLFNEILEPDAIFRIDTIKGSKLYTFELENKTYKAKSIKKINKHIKFISEKIASKKYEHSKGNRTLFVYTDYAIMKNVMQEVQKIGDTKSWLLFKHLDDVVPEVNVKAGKFNLVQEKNYFDNWLTASNEVVSMY